MPTTIVVTDHAIQRLRERCGGAYPGAEHRLADSQWCIARIENLVHTATEIDVSYPPLRLWLTKVMLEEHEFLCWAPTTRIVLICKRERGRVIVKTVFRAVCRQCEKADCWHVRKAAEKLSS